MISRTAATATVGPANRVAGVLPTAVVIAGVVWVLVITDTPWMAALKLAAIFMVSVVLPGIALHRVARGPQQYRVAELGLGTAVGFLWHLIVWAGGTAVGLSTWWWYVAWGLVPVLVVVAVPGLRERARGSRRPVRLPSGVAWVAVIALFSMLARQVVDVGATHQLPWRDGRAWENAWYNDMYFHLGIVNELMHHAVPQTPQVAQLPLNYHWFSSASMAGLASGSGVDPAIVLTRFWSLPVHLTVVGLLVALGHLLARRAFAGALAAVLVALGPVLSLAWISIPGTVALAPYSPSQDIGIMVSLLGANLIIAILRGSNNLGVWPLLVAAMIAAMGAKSSVLPVLFAGVIVALVVLIVKRQRWWPVAAIAVVGVGAFLLMRPLATGGAAGVRIQWAAFLPHNRAWQVLNEGTVEPYALNIGLLPIGTDQLQDHVFLVLVALAAVLNFGWVILLGWGPLRRGDPSAWLLFGAGGAAMLVSLILNQDGLSQAYFMAGAQPLLAGLAAWGVVEVWQRARGDESRRIARAVAVAALGVGLVASVLDRRLVGSAPKIPLEAWMVPLVTLGGACIITVAGVAWWVLIGRHRDDCALVRLAICLAVLGMALAPRLLASWSNGVGAQPPNMSRVLWAIVATVVLLTLVVLPAVGGWRRLTRAVLVSGLVFTTLMALSWHQPPKTVGGMVVDAQETAAAHWLGVHADADDIVATNLHCVPQPTVEHCNARSFWVSGLSGQRVLVEGWGYTPAAHEAHGRGGYRYDRQPFSEPRLLALNEKAFRDPDPQTIEQLHSLGVRWLFADTKAGPVSPLLAQMADKVHVSGTVTIYRLRQS